MFYGRKMHQRQNNDKATTISLAEALWEPLTFFKVFPFVTCYSVVEGPTLPNKTKNVIAIMNHMGVYLKEEPIRELHRSTEGLNFRIVYPNDRESIPLKLIEITPALRRQLSTGINIT